MSDIQAIIIARKDKETPDLDDTLDVLKALDCLTDSINSLVTEIQRQQGR
jgi:hypothetical protein